MAQDARRSRASITSEHTVHPKGVDRGSRTLIKQMRLCPARTGGALSKSIHRPGLKPVDKSNSSYTGILDEEKPFALAETPLPEESPWREALSPGRSIGFQNIAGPMPSTSYPRPSQRPLIDYVTNVWVIVEQKYSKLGANSKAGGSNYCPASMKDLLILASAPRLRRYIIVYLILLWICLGSWIKLVSPRLREHNDLLRALDPNFGDGLRGWFGLNSMPKFNDLVYLRSLDPKLLPGEKEPSADSPHKKRLIVIGDVHGCLDELETLLQNVNFDPGQGDHLIFTGDLIAKGPKSTGVVDLARKFHASCVRGNHEDRVLLTRRHIQAEASTKSERSPAEEPDQIDDDIEPANMERALANELTDEQAKWLDACPVMLKWSCMVALFQALTWKAKIPPP
ncbi:serine/threonine phosphatase [Histoplasma capsulatum]|uniref:Serine/threonine phosphatase n=1 Tax=Ajellomyces capsulatus TaxID=5037 RepID=A0A8A1M1X7_AJECA|nr:serine/threonine phosphatase [Histoplasma capsulatum]